MKQAKTLKELGLSNKDILMWLLLFMLIYFRRFITYITQFFPFSLLPENFYAHHKNIELNAAWDLVRDETYKAGNFMNIKEARRDQYFIHITGIFPKKNKNIIGKIIGKIKKILGETNFYSKQIDDSQFTFMIAKGSIEKAKKLKKIKPLLNI
jgi:hypothetical protein